MTLSYVVDERYVDRLERITRGRVRWFFALLPAAVFVGWFSWVISHSWVVTGIPLAGMGVLWFLTVERPRGRRRSRAALPVGSTIRAGFGDIHFVVEFPDASSLRAPYARYSTLQIKSGFAVLSSKRERSYLPAELFPEAVRGRFGRVTS